MDTTAPAIRTTAQVAKELSIPTYTLLRYLRLGVVEEPVRCGQFRAWDRASIDAARRAIAEAKGESEHEQFSA